MEDNKNEVERGMQLAAELPDTCLTRPMTGMIASPC